MESYIDDKKNLYTIILEFLENSDESNESSIENIKSIITKVEGDREEIEQFLQIIKNISDNHHRDRNFITKISQILQQFEDQIKQTLSNIDIFHIFEDNKMILLFLLKSGILTISDSIFKEMMLKVDSSGYFYCHFFYPELEKFAGEEKMKDIKDELLLNNPNMFENFDMKRQEGENDSYICSLIRQDSVEDFIAHVNRANYSLSSKISPSIFETNNFLLEKKNTTLNEYSAFYGSIQIFQYLKMNKVKLTPSLWLYAIHSKNAELIHLLESNNVPPPDEKENDNKNSTKSYIKCLTESIKCHHNDFADYIENNLMVQNENDSKQKEEIISNSIKYHNYAHFQSQLVHDHGLFFLRFYEYNKLVDLLMKEKKNEIKERIIQNTNICF